MAVGLSRVVVHVYGLGLFQNYKSYCMHSHIICIRVAAAIERVVYEVVAEPQEPLEQAQFTPVQSSNPKASPGA